MSRGALWSVSCQTGRRWGVYAVVVISVRMVEPGHIYAVNVLHDYQLEYLELML